ncbi:GAF domain-containing protein [Streptomyces roseirectus]|uniref:GAF domain-containing protein n=1 Tax=Streptomyces roseirectus TaxID=2768066 RepID=A0A7H0IFU4_9ACTN|nr:GAF domain-containing protein [Streptomyces roseirectus]QNP71660.1 GAF domain-containing protein [Streptomyces roseirectus]
MAVDPAESRLLEALRSIGGDLDRIPATAMALLGVPDAAVEADGDGSGWALAVPIHAHGEPYGSLCLAARPDGRPFDDADLDLVRVLVGEAGLAIGNARLHEAARQRERWIDGSVAVTTALLADDDPDDALQVVAEAARTLAEAATGVVMLPAENSGLEIVAVASGGRSELLGQVIPVGNDLVKALLDGQEALIDDASSDPRSITSHTDEYGAVLLLPLRGDGRFLGTLGMARASGRPTFSAAERELARRFAEQAALALVAAEAQRDRERLAVFEERDRIARDLHDLVVQRLFTIGLTLGGAQREAVTPEVREGVGRAVDELDVTIQEIRAAIFALRQGPGEAPSELRTRVLREVAMAAVPLGFTPGCRFAGDVDALVGEVTGKNLLAALREALSNSFRHAHASRIDVVVDATATLPDGRPGVRLTVADDGVGITGGGRRSGLLNLVRRAESLGGASGHGPGIGAGGGGTTVVWEAPY